MYLLTSYLVVSIHGRDFCLEHHNEIKFQNMCFQPHIDVYLPCCGEPIGVLENTYKHVSNLDWPAHLLNVYVLDDGPRPHTVQALTQEFGFHYMRREDVGVMKKAGNLRHAFSRTSGDFILILDADFVPRTDFLQETVPYMKAYDDVAILQTPQYFQVLDNQRWIERAAGSIQELFYRFVQQNRQRFDASICVGSCALYRRTALQPFGGTALVSASEDVYTGFRVTNAGSRVYYIPVILSMGVCPDEAKSFFNQQYRWSLGSMTLLSSAEFWMSNLTKMQKTCYMTGGLYYVATALSVLSTALPSIFLALLRPALVYWFNVIYAIPSTLFPYIAMRVWNTQPYDLASIRVRNVQYIAHLAALFDKVSGTHMLWVPTGSAGMKKKNTRYNNCMALLLLVTIVELNVLYCLSVWRIDQGYHFVNFLPSLFLETFNACIIFQVFFMNE
jgi:cellulose synthase/poly-beta-1,6-N-acetylglucosamine synthase-like glycosyltransferase